MRPFTSSHSSARCGGNFGAPPKPPCRASNEAARAAVRRAGVPADRGTCPRAAATAWLAATSSARRAATFSISLRRVRQSSASASRIVRKPGRPCRSSGGKYVPAKNGRRSGSRKAESGQPPRPVISWTARHVDVVHVGALLAVHLDRDEVVVQEARDLLVLERLALHDVAPVARRVADGEKDGLFLPPRLLERLVSPRVPVDGVAARAAGGTATSRGRGGSASAVRLRSFVHSPRKDSDRDRPEDAAAAQTPRRRRAPRRVTKASPPSEPIGRPCDTATERRAADSARK